MRVRRATCTCRSCDHIRGIPLPTPMLKCERKRSISMSILEHLITPIDRPGVTKSLLAAKGRTDLGQEGAIIFLPRKH